MNIAVVGGVTEGLASYAYFTARGDSVTICDLNPELAVPTGANTRLGEHYLNNLDEFDLVVRSAGIKPSTILEKNPNIADKMTSQVNEFLANCPTKNIVGVTGTKGKGTTSTLITKMLEASGKVVHIGGNIGIPVFELIEKIKPEDWVVLELSSFQLMDCRHSPHIAVCLMVVPEHLDWHEDFEEYIAAKQQLFINQGEDDVAIYYAENENSESIASASEGQLIPYMETPGAYVDNGKVTIDNQIICTTEEIALLGKHNWQNVCAAVTAVWQVTQNIEAMRSVIKSFTGLPFRIEFRKEVDQIRYYNDSFATAAGATIAAMNSIKGYKVIIIGGFDRGLNLDCLGSELVRLKKEIRKIVLIGASGKRTADVLKKAGFDNYVLCKSKDMANIIQTCKSYAKEGDAVILSPAFASFDMFKNFEERGKKFNEAIDSL